MDIKYNFVFTNEVLCTNQVQADETIRDMRAYYDNEVYENSRLLFQSLQSSFPSQFSSYESTYYQMNYQNLCEV